MTHYARLEEEGHPQFDQSVLKLKEKSDSSNSETGAYIESWANATRGDSLRRSASVMESDGYVVSELKFEVVSARTIQSPKKYVAYTVMVRKEGSVPDERPSVVERRYSEFLELYTKLCQEFPAIFSPLTFPKKAVLGNFSPEMISSRSSGFESLLSKLTLHEKVRESPSVITFLLQKERTEALRLIQEKEFKMAIVLLENGFRLLNKLFTNRHPRVLQALCLLVACCEAAGSEQTLHFAQTAVLRYEAVSDADSLCYYVPLLQLCVRVLHSSGAAQDRQVLQDRLDCMKRRGVRVDGCLPLLDVVMSNLQSTSS